MDWPRLTAARYYIPPEKLMHFEIGKFSLGLEFVITLGTDVNAIRDQVEQIDELTLLLLS